MAEKDADTRELNIEKKSEIEAVYADSEFDRLRLPPRISVKTIFASVLASILFGAIFGFISGFIAAKNQKLAAPFSKMFAPDNAAQKELIVQTSQGNVLLHKDDYINELIARLEAQTVKIFSKADFEGANVINQILIDKKSIARGFIITNDGWLATGGHIVRQDGLASIKDNYIAVASGNKSYSIEKVVVDPLTNIMYLKLAASDKSLSVVEFADKENILAGLKTIILSDSNSVRISYLSNALFRKIAETGDLVLSTEKLQEFLLLNDYFDYNLSGSPVFDFNGAVIGVLAPIEPNQADQAGASLGKDLAAGVNTAIPAVFLQNSLGQLLKNQEIRRPRLGIEYLDLSAAAGITNQKFKNYSHGALVYGAPNLGSPARAGGLKNGDIIIKVNNASINANQSLTEIIQEHLPGDKLDITFIREETEKIITVQLGEM